MKMTVWTISLLLLIPFYTYGFSVSAPRSMGHQKPTKRRRVVVENVITSHHDSLADYDTSIHISRQRRNNLILCAISSSSPSEATDSSFSIRERVGRIPTISIVRAVLNNISSHLDQLYDKSIRIKCPFFRRRAADIIDNTASVIRFLLIRHKSLPGISDLFLDSNVHVDDDVEEENFRSSFLSSSSLLPPQSAYYDKTDNDDDQNDNNNNNKFFSMSTQSKKLLRNLIEVPGCKPLGCYIQRLPDGTSHKVRDQSLEYITNQIQNDWMGGKHGIDKGYYITGKLDSTIYTDDCLFTSPDPDMPVRGLRKYLNAASQLFDPKLSTASLLSILLLEEAGDYQYGTEKDGQYYGGVIEVTWRIEGVIQLPWHPTVEPWTGKTRYHLNKEHLIYWHEETWDISVWRAFLCTLFPQAKTWKVWKDDNNVETATLPLPPPL